MTEFKTPVGFVNGLRGVIEKRGLTFDEKAYSVLGDEYRPIKDGVDADLFDLQTGLEAEFDIEIDNRAITFGSTVANLHAIVQFEVAKKPKVA